MIEYREVKEMGKITNTAQWEADLTLVQIIFALMKLILMAGIE